MNKTKNEILPKMKRKLVSAKSWRVEEEEEEARMEALEDEYGSHLHPRVSERERERERGAARGG